MLLSEHHLDMEALKSPSLLCEFLGNDTVNNHPVQHKLMLTVSKLTRQTQANRILSSILLGVPSEGDKIGNLIDLKFLEFNYVN